MPLTRDLKITAFSWARPACYLLAHCIIKRYMLKTGVKTNAVTIITNDLKYKHPGEKQLAPENIMK